MSFSDCKVDLGGELSGYLMSSLPDDEYQRQLDEDSLTLMPVAHRILNTSLEFVPNPNTCAMISDGSIVVTIRKATQEEREGYEQTMKETE